MAFFFKSSSGTNGEEGAAKRSNVDESVRALSALLLTILLGLTSILIYSFHASSGVQRVSFATVGILTAMASLLTGVLLGFLFGIPRTLQKDVVVQSSQNSSTLSDQHRQVDYAPNTNLEQISDWLTKILVGVGLTQLPQISRKLQQLAGVVSAGLGKTDSSNIFSLAIILFFGICGFLFGYLWTRLYLLGAIKKADINALALSVENTNKEVQQVNKKLQELEKQAKLDAVALSLVQRHLNPSIDIPAVELEELSDAIKTASIPLKIQIFTTAQDIRSGNWKKNKAKMALTIPIFRALIADDTKSKFHRNYAQMGYALKDQEKPDWKQAEEHLTKAIHIRGNWKEKGWLFYEFNRAICRINLDENLLNEQLARPEVSAPIVEDLRAVFSNKDLKKLILGEDHIGDWIKKNNIVIN